MKEYPSRNARLGAMPLISWGKIGITLCAVPSLELRAVPTILIGLFLCLIALPAWAELPPEVLDKEYTACAGDGQDAQRSAYCVCVRDEMRNWTEQDYMDTAQAASASNGGTGSVTPSKLTEVAKECIAKTLH